MQRMQFSIVFHSVCFNATSDKYSIEATHNIIPDY